MWRQATVVARHPHFQRMTLKGLPLTLSLRVRRVTAYRSSVLPDRTAQEFGPIFSTSAGSYWPRLIAFVVIVLSFLVIAVRASPVPVSFAEGESSFVRVLCGFVGAASS